MSHAFLMYFGIINKYRNIIQKEALYELGTPIDKIIEIINHQEEVDEFLAELREIGYTYKVHQEIIYNADEMRSFEYAFIDMTKIARKNIKLEDNDKGPEKFGTQFTVPKCMNCNSNRTIAGVFHIPKNLDISFDIGFLYPSIIIKREVYEIFQNEGLQGCSYEMCLNDGGNSVENQFYRLSINNVLPDMSQKIEYNFIKCEQCGREYLKYCPENISYNIKDKGKFKDFNISSEQINVLGKNRVPYGIPIVSNRVIKLILNHKLTGITFKPIFFSG